MLKLHVDQPVLEHKLLRYLLEVILPHMKLRAGWLQTIYQPLHLLETNDPRHVNVLTYQPSLRLNPHLDSSPLYLPLLNGIHPVERVGTLHCAMTLSEESTLSPTVEVHTLSLLFRGPYFPHLSHHTLSTVKELHLFNPLYYEGHILYDHV